MELLFDIITHCSRCRGGKSTELTDGKFIRSRSDFAVCRTEIMSPLTDTVSLIHHQHFRRTLCQKAAEKVGMKAFRRHVEKFDFPVSCTVDDIQLS